MDLILSSILGPVCERVINTAIEEYRSVRDVKEEIRKLRTTVDMIKGVLEDAERKQVESHFIRKWLKELKQVLFDAEDVFDEIATDEALEKDVKDGTSRLSKVRKLIFSVDHSSSSRDIARQVKDINKKFDDILKDNVMSVLNVFDVTSGSVFRRPRPDTSSLLPSCEAHIIGRDGEMQKIEELLLEYSAEGIVAATSDNYKNVHVISVVGMGGVGKTTLVKHAYNSPAVTEYFQLRMWVCVSNYFDVERITREIMDAAASSSEQTRDEFVDTSNWDVVQKRLKGKLEGKRFLLVLDDMWEKNHSKWDRLCTPLMYGGKGSKIIVTTRSHAVLNITKGTPIFLKDLPSEDLWIILQKYAFDGYDPVKYPQLVIEGKKIVDKLKGSPLAARTIGRVLNENLDVSDWRNILSSKVWVSHDCEDSILPILKLSYDHLPGHLKQCFAYCSLFPEDHEFDKDELVQLWIAQQFIIKNRRGFFHVENEGGVYLDKLVHMSLFEKYTNRDDQARFVMHDLIHNLTEIVSEGDCLRLEDNQQNGTISDTVRHVSIASDRFDLPKIEQLCNKYENMRTLLFLHGCKFQLDRHLDSIFMKLQRLRVLGLNGCGIRELPASIGTLKHLRFLDLSANLITKLPDSLCNLHNLQVLNLTRCERIRALPRNMSALINLRHLFGNDYLVGNIAGLGKLTALHELDYFDCIRQSIKELADMGMLRRLRIKSLERVKSREEAAESRLDKKEHLDELRLEWGNYVLNHPGSEEVLDSLQPPSSIRRLTIYNYGGSRSPSWMEEDQSWLRDSCFLRTLELYNCRNWEVLPPLGQLLRLDSLTISRMSSVRRIGPAFMGCCVCHALEGGAVVQLPQGGFPSLQVLEFEDMEEWEEWEVPLGTDDDGGEDDQVLSEAPRPLFLTRLRELTISHCPKLRQLPPLPPTLTKFEIMYAGLTHLPEWWLSSSSSSSSSSCSSSPSLSSLEIRDCQELTSLAEGLLRHPLPNLVKLKIIDCPKLRQLPPLPPTLTELEIVNVGLSHLPEWWLSSSSSSSSSSCSSSSPSLSSLEIRDCRELTSLADGLLRHPLPNLVKLIIIDCPKLRQLPPLPPTLTELIIRDAGLTHFPGWRLPPSSSLPCCCPSSSSSSSPYSLCSVEISDCPNLEGDDDGEDDQVLSDAPPLPPQRQHHRRPLFLARLRELTIWNCPKLRQLPPLPPALTQLEIVNVGLTHLPEWWLPTSSTSSLLPCCSSSSPSLSSLEIYDCQELTSLADGLLRHPLPNLVELKINSCWGLVSLRVDRAFGHLTSLKELVVARCPKLAWPSVEEDTGLPPSLESITIEGVCGDVMDQMMLAIVDSSQKLACLRKLDIMGCFSRPLPPTLRRSLPSSLQDLTIYNNDQLDGETLSAWLRGLTSLKRLYIRECPAVTSLPRAEVLSLLTALKILQIERLKALSSFGGGIHCLVSLEELDIGDCPELLDVTTTAADSSRPSSSSALPSPAGMGTSTTRIRKLEISESSMQQIKRWLLQCPFLQHLSISRCPQLTGFGGNNDGGDDVVGGELEAALLNLSGTLHQLDFWGCDNIRSLPPRLRCLSSLQSLRIEYCPQIPSLPVAGLPESLRELEIRSCPALEERCKEAGEGSDWPLISHVPSLLIFPW